MDETKISNEQKECINILLNKDCLIDEYIDLQKELNSLYEKCNKIFKIQELILKNLRKIDIDIQKENDENNMCIIIIKKEKHLI